MRNLLLTLLACSFLFFSCSFSKENKKYRNLIKGSWNLNKVTYQGTSGKLKLKLFNQADAVCFEGSQWFFYENNSTGKYTLSQDAHKCPYITENIRWSIYDDGMGNPMLQFKSIDNRKKDISDGYGYRLQISSVTEGQMILKERTLFEGKPLDVLYHFEKQ